MSSIECIKPLLEEAGWLRFSTFKKITTKTYFSSNFNFVNNFGSGIHLYHLCDIYMKWYKCLFISNKPNIPSTNFTYLLTKSLLPYEITSEHTLKLLLSHLLLFLRHKHVFLWFYGSGDILNPCRCFQRRSPQMQFQIISQTWIISTFFSPWGKLFTFLNPHEK